MRVGGDFTRPADVPAERLTNQESTEGASDYRIPFAFALAYLLIDYGRPQDWLPALRALRPGMVVLAINILLLLGRQRRRLQTPLKFVLVFLCLMIALVPVARNSRAAFYTAWNFALLVFGAVLPIAVSTDSYHKVVRLVRFFVWLHVPLALYSLSHRGIGMGSFLNDENDFCLAFNMVLPYAMSLFFLARSFPRKLLMLGIGLLILAAATATFSRGGFVGLVSVGLMIWLRSRRKGLALLASMALVVGVYSVTPTSYWSEIGSIQTAANRGDTGDTRLYYWTLGWRMFQDHPIVGVGPNNFQFNTLRYDQDLRNNGVWGRVAHSLYFTVLPEYGIPGVVLFSLIIVTGWTERRRVRKRLTSSLASQLHSDDDNERSRTLIQFMGAVDASLIAFLTTGAFISVVYYPHLWILTAFSAALSSVGGHPIFVAESVGTRNAVACCDRDHR
jgi:putative inorganic carbon (hco3(-)) transporter